LAALALAVHLPATKATHAQDDPSPGIPGVRQDLPFADLLGPWVRNDTYSENPARRVEGLASGDDASRMSEIARAVASRFGTLMVRVLDDHVAILDGDGGMVVLPFDGKRRRLGGGVRGRVLEAGETLRIEIRASGVRQVETFQRDGEWLVRWTDLEARNLPSFQIDTVYERPELAPDPGSWATGLPQTAIRIVPPTRRYGEMLAGRVEIQTLIIDPRIREVQFLLDGRPVRRARQRPFGTRIRLAAPPREQILEVRAYGQDEAYLGNDEFVLNRRDRPFGVRIAEMRGAEAEEGNTIRVSASVSLPRAATLERVEFYRGDFLVEAAHTFGEEAAPGAARTFAVGTVIQSGRSDDFIRVVAKLSDGREREDAQLLQGSDYQSEIDIQLAQFQVLVTDGDGNPVSGLSPEDFEIREDGRKRPAVALHTSVDVPLVLGLAIDSSDSMLPAWSRLKYIARTFLETAVTADDRAFLVDFDHTVRLIQPLTGDGPLLSERLDYLIPMGGTALNDGLLFSLLQYRGEPGRRALVVITDGADENSRSRPEQSSEFAERLGLPIYFIELDAFRPGSGGVAATNRDRERLRRISEQTGGRLFRLELYGDTPWWTEPIEQVFTRIQEDLRHQHVLTYYTNQPPGDPIEPEIRLTRRGLTLRSAVPLPGIE
jgi:Ca-activated chloride channel family protein